MTHEENYLMHLIRCVMSGEELKRPSDSVDMTKLYKAACRNQVTTIVYEALIKADFSIDNQVWEKLKQMYDKALIKDVAQEANFSLVSELFEKNNIRYIPLKGIVLKKLYPSSHLRQSADIDIYADDENTAEICRIMGENGFKFEPEGIGFGMHDKYILNGLVNIEVHRYLMEKDTKKWYQLGVELIKNAKQEAGYAYALTKEDHYLFVLLHAVKHLRYTGVSVKVVLDIWVYLKKYANDMDWNYIKRMLEEYDLSKIESNLRALTACWFENKECKNSVVRELGDYIVSNGMIATKAQLDKAVAIEQSSAKHFAKAFFMPYKQMTLKYKILKPMPFLLPVMWVYRAGYSIVKKDTLKKRVQSVRELERDSVKELEQFKKRIGIK